MLFLSLWSCFAALAVVRGSGSAHQVVQGRTSWKGWGSEPESYCQRDDNNQAAYSSTKHGYDLGVGCCSMDGSSGHRPNCKAHPATYDEAEAICAAAGSRLCSAQELLSGLTAKKGCWYDAAYQWTSDECSLEEVLFSAAGPFQPVWGTSIGTVDVRDSMHYEFDLHIHSFPETHIWSNVLFIGNRLPVVHIDEEFNFIVKFRGSGGQNVFDSQSFGDKLVAGHSYHYEFDMDQDWFRGTVDGVVVVDQACGPHDVLEDQTIYVSHPSKGWGEADVSLSNILISSQ